jgi:hypothetical protein
MTDAPSPPPETPTPDAEPSAHANAQASADAVTGADTSAAAKPDSGATPQTNGDPTAFPNAWIASLLIVASLVMVLWNLQDSSLDNANTGSRFATIESLVDHGTYHIDKSQYVRTIDKVKVGKNYISTKPPALPTYAAGVYWVFQKITGKTIAANEGAVVWLVSLFTGWLAHAVFLIYLWRLARLLFQRQLALIGTLSAACFSYLGVAYATTINNHSIGAAIGLVGFYYAFRIRNEYAARPRHWIQAGLCFGFLTAVDLPCGAWMAAAVVYLGTYDWRRTLFLFVPALLPGLMSQLLLSYEITGSLKPAYENSELKQFKDNYFRGGQRGIDALREPKPLYLFNVLIGHHGVFSMTPLLGFGLWELVRSLKRKVRMPESILVAGVCLVITAFYVYRTRNYGGWCVGMRHLIPIMPLLLIYFGLWLDRVKLTRWLWSIVLAAFAVGSFNVQDGLSSPFQFSLWHNWLEGQPNRSRVGKKLNLGKGRAKATKPPAKPPAKLKPN